jgi:ferrous iron transport protein B
LNTALGPLLPGLVMLAMYLVGVVAAVVVAWTLKKTVLRGETPPFVLELPSYKWPSATLVLHRMAERGWAFVYRAGTVVLAASVIIWALGYYPHDESAAQQAVERQRTELTARAAAAPAGSSERRALNQELAEFAEPANLENRLAGAMQANSYLGRLGRAIEPVVRPLGWDWRIGCAAIASFPAREVVMGVLGVIYNLGEVDVGDAQGQGALRSRLQAATWDGTNEPVYNLPVALSIMVFFALCAQCVSTLAIIRRETNGWAWPVFTFTYMTVLAYFGALVTYQVGRLWL